MIPRREFKAKLAKGKRDWYSIKNSAEASLTEIYIYDEIGYFGITAQDFVRDMREVDSDKIELHLNTPGGEVFDGIAIYNVLRDHRAHVTVIVDSLAASIGSVIAMAGDEVYMGKNSTMMIHEGHGLAVGDSADMTQMADLLNKTSQNIASIYADRAGGSVEDWRTKMKAETWFSASEAVEAGLADRIVGQEEDTEEEEEVEISNLFNYHPSAKDIKSETDFDISAVFREALKEATEQ